MKLTYLLIADCQSRSLPETQTQRGSSVANRTVPHWMEPEPQPEPELQRSEGEAAAQMPRYSVSSYQCSPGQYLDASVQATAASHPQR